MKKRVISINAKCSDLFCASLTNNGHHVGDYDGYVPEFFPGQHYGDYVELRIDVDTGQILNWKKPTEKQLKDTFKPSNLRNNFTSLESESPFGFSQGDCGLDGT